uniref:Fibronectin type III domain-containing protein n=1 Tax=Candidatus Kentrum sp. DK TaxID=2126562 RepID=A0A450SYQ8_9GAMM|nr:MAG: Fibronectin type III domain-containing protein [Candidatus Kentron sp. DK]
MQFPEDEEGVVELGHKMSAGLKANADIFPAPPVSPLELDEALTTHAARQEAAVAAQSALAQVLEAKNDSLESVADRIRNNLRYAEHTVDFNDAKLKSIGWGGRAEKTPLAAPGQPMELMIVEEGDDWISLKWKRPVTGGKVAGYKVLYRERPETKWKVADMAMTTEATLRDQPRGKEIEYGVIAVNKTGEGQMSSIVMVVL